MSILDYTKRQERSYFDGAQAKARQSLGERIIQNINETWKRSDSDLVARNRYEDTRGHLWLEENDYVFGLLTKTIRYARETFRQDVADKVYIQCHNLQKKLRKRKMKEKEYSSLKSKSIEDLAKYLSKKR